MESSPPASGWLYLEPPSGTTSHQDVPAPATPMARPPQEKVRAPAGPQTQASVSRQHPRELAAAAGALQRAAGESSFLPRVPLPGSSARKKPSAGAGPGGRRMDD